MGAMTRIVNGVHPVSFLESGDCVIFSSKIIPGNEKKLYQLQNFDSKNKIRNTLPRRTHLFMCQVILIETI